MEIQNHRPGVLPAPLRTHILCGMKSAPDRVSSRKPAVLRSAAAFVCLAVLFFLPEMGIGQTAEKEQRRSADSTDPENPKSPPPYHTYLQLTQIVIRPYRMMFMGHDFNPNKPNGTTFQINTIDRGNRTYFLKLGDKIPDTKFKVTAFKPMEIPDRQGTNKDASELTVTDGATDRKAVLPFREVVDSPDRQAVFKYNWIEPGGKETPPFVVRPGGSFTLPPDRTKTCKLIRIEGQDAVIELPDGTRKILVIPK